MDGCKAHFHPNVLCALDALPRPGVVVSIEPLYRHRRSGGRRAKRTTIFPSLVRSVKALREVESPCMDMCGFSGTLARSLMDAQKGGNGRLEPHRPTLAQQQQQPVISQPATASGRVPKPAVPAMHGNFGTSMGREEGEQRYCLRSPVPRLRLLPSLESCSASSGGQLPSDQMTQARLARSTHSSFICPPATARASSHQADSSARSILAHPFLSARGAPTSGASSCLLSPRHRTAGGAPARRPVFHSAEVELQVEDSNLSVRQSGRAYWAASDLLASYRDVGAERSPLRRALAKQASMMLRVQVGRSSSQRPCLINQSPTGSNQPNDCFCRMKHKFISLLMRIRWHPGWRHPVQTCLF